MVALFKGYQEEWACFGGPRLSHEASTTDGVALGFRQGGRGIGQQIVGLERCRMPKMGIQGRHQRRAFQHDAHAGVTTPVNAAFMSFGLSEPAFQVQIVAWQVRVVWADK